MGVCSAMWIYSSSWSLGASGVVMGLVALWLVTGRNPFGVIWSALRVLVTEHRFLALVLLAYSMLALNLLEARVEANMAPSITWDFTRQVAQVGTGFLLALQRLEWAPLTHLFTFVYVILFPVLMIAALLHYVAIRDFAALRNHVVGYWVNYLVALPFYLWFPVKEAWAGGVGVRFLIPQVFLAFEQVYRPHSGLDNCFPSLHTSLALTYALVAYRNGHKRLGAVLGVGAGLVMFSTLYLGVHWVLDVAAGSLLALLASGYVTDLLPATTQPNFRTDP